MIVKLFDRYEKKKKKKKKLHHRKETCRADILNREEKRLKHVPAAVVPSRCLWCTEGEVFVEQFEQERKKK